MDNLAINMDYMPTFEYSELLYLPYALYRYTQWKSRKKLKKVFSVKR